MALSEWVFRDMPSPGFEDLEFHPSRQPRLLFFQLHLCLQTSFTLTPQLPSKQFARRISGQPVHELDPSTQFLVSGSLAGHEFLDFFREVGVAVGPDISFGDDKRAWQLGGFGVVPDGGDADVLDLRMLAYNFFELGRRYLESVE